MRVIQAYGTTACHTCICGPIPASSRVQNCQDFSYTASMNPVFTQAHELAQNFLALPMQKAAEGRTEHLLLPRIIEQRWAGSLPVSRV